MNNNVPLGNFTRYWQMLRRARRNPLFLIMMGFASGYPADVFSAPVMAAKQDKIVIGDFSNKRLDAWQSKAFKGETAYRLVDLDGRTVLRAQSHDSGSGLFKEQRIDLQQTPFLNWSWRIANRLGTLNEQTKAGDDYAARVYVIISGGVAFWRTRAINYVWASNSPKDKAWPNAFAGDHAMMLALRSTDDPLDSWQTEKRNIRADLQRFYGEDIRHIDAVAIMTDTDNAGGNVTAYYGDIYFTPQ